MGSREIINGQPSDYRYIVKHHCKIFYLIMLTMSSLLLYGTHDAIRNIWKAY